MSFTEHSDGFIWSCNGEGCDKEVMFAPHDFMACVAEVRARGWRFVLEEDTGREDSGRTWYHYCGRCQNKRKYQKGDWMDRKFSTVK